MPATNQLDSIIIQYDFSDNIRLQEISKALLALDAYTRRGLQQDPILRQHKPNLIVEEISYNSPFKAKIIPILTQLVLVTSLYNQFHETVDNMTSDFNFLMGEETQKTPAFTNSSLENLDDIIKPVTRANGSVSIKIEGNNNSDIIINQFLGKDEAREIHENIKIEKEKLVEGERILKKNVLLELDRASRHYDDTDRGIIKSVSEKPETVIFLHEILKNKVKNNPFNMNYIVDVEILTINDVVSAYYISAIHKVEPHNDVIQPIEENPLTLNLEAPPEP